MRSSVGPVQGQVMSEQGKVVKGEQKRCREGSRDSGAGVGEGEVIRSRVCSGEP